MPCSAFGTEASTIQLVKALLILSRGKHLSEVAVTDYESYKAVKKMLI